MILENHRKQIFVVCDIIDQDTIFVHLSNYIFLKEANKDKPAIKVPIDEFKQALADKKIYIKEL
jgi:hypothetical protein